MNNTHDISTGVWQAIGGIEAGAISALALVPPGDSTADANGLLKNEGYELFIGTKIGLYRSRALNGDVSWYRLASGPVGVMALATSPTFHTDHTVIAGADSGIFVSNDAGESWRSARIPFGHSMTLALSFSPNYMMDGIVLAGTLEDGVWMSHDRGESWYLQSFGLLDAAILSLAISPCFTQDDSVFAGTDTAIYYTYNQARAWKQLGFPDAAAPVAALALSPAFDADGTLYAGTERGGLYRSTDRGDSWEKLSLPAYSINALLITPCRRLVAATEAGIFASSDQGAQWDLLAPLTNAISLVNQDEMIVAGMADEGLWKSAPDGGSDWQPVRIPSIRTVYGLALSPDFAHDQAAYMYGPQEGIWRSQDGAHSWHNISDDLPTLDIDAVIPSPRFAADHTLLATSRDGLLISLDSGDHWQLITPESTSILAFSPDAQSVCAAFPEAGLRLSHDRGQTWHTISGPWDSGGKVVQIAFSSANCLHVALLAGTENVLTVWRGITDAFEQVLAQPTIGNAVVSLCIPHGPGDVGYAALGNRVWRLITRTGSDAAEPAIVGDGAAHEDIVSLVAGQDTAGLTLLACTSRGLYRSMDAETWTKVQGFNQPLPAIGAGARPAPTADEKMQSFDPPLPVVAFALSPAYPSDRTGYALLLGGTVMCGAV